MQLCGNCTCVSLLWTVTQSLARLCIVQCERTRNRAQPTASGLPHGCETVHSHLQKKKTKSDITPYPRGHRPRHPGGRTGHTHIPHQPAHIQPSRHPEPGSCTGPAAMQRRTSREAVDASEIPPQEAPQRHHTPEQPDRPRTQQRGERRSISLYSIHAIQ